MPKSLEERIAESKAKTAQLEQNRRAELYRERKIKKKLDQRRNYIVGELVCKYFPALKELKPETKEQDNETFKKFEEFLSTLASDQNILNKENF